jgi:hypothetical protein
MVVRQSWSRWILCAGAVLLLLPRAAGSQQVELLHTRHWSGQGVAPVFEGFDINPDGSHNLWFGYMNRNFEEELDIPVGAENAFEPGGDRGQPTHFATRRHKAVFRVTVPKDFGNQKLVWKLTVRGKTEVVAGSINPVWQIDRRRTTRGGSDDAVDSNTPPAVTVQPAVQTVRMGAPATFSVTATDDGLPKRRSPLGAGEGGRRAQGPAGLSAEWLKYRGPGQVIFSPREAMLDSGKGTTTATFSAPGEYLLQVVVDDGSGESAGNFGYHCCWTNVEVKVVVQDGNAPK